LGLAPLAAVAAKLGLRETVSPWKSTERITTYQFGGPVPWSDELEVDSVVNPHDYFGEYDLKVYMRTDLTDWDNVTVRYNRG